ncbi:hypothetical protein MTZ49_01375 [Entomomonas sp. E2T0]|uniref:hypothetical protein n=1 Tax=Entomomonas sp. E2T0 TaxID=2930213 RepID=UPI0022283605|nr:hypothetical protein [Entomomonas sp. E2T0]UYZ84258.1 hypothetical protein MTZ49_01375 [Entomomonas sp. E2T0]
MSTQLKQAKRPYKEYLVRLSLDDALRFDNEAKGKGLKGGTYMRLLILENMKTKNSSNQ